VCVCVSARACVAFARLRMRVWPGGAGGGAGVVRRLGRRCVHACVAGAARREGSSVAKNMAATFWREKSHFSERWRSQCGCSCATAPRAPRARVRTHTHTRTHRRICKGIHTHIHLRTRICTVPCAHRGVCWWSWPASFRSYWADLVSPPEAVFSVVSPLTGDVPPFACAFSRGAWGCANAIGHVRVGDLLRSGVCEWVVSVPACVRTRVLTV
jgi:hypothetical protein